MRAWPKEDLEAVPACPACGSADRAPLLEGVVDQLFGCPGAWTLVRCEGCRTAYLDPRPTEASIGRAYTAYHTHQATRPGNPLLERRGLKAALFNGYLNRAYGHRLPNANPLGGALLPLRAFGRSRQDFLIRHLPAPVRPDAALLDMGCGAGDFLPIAQALGYRAVGVDPDPKAVAAAKALGREAVQGSLPDLPLADGAFDQITLSHVFEHLHRPAASLMRLKALLRPGGRLWLSVPNLASKGFTEFGADWRGLEPPRHLTLYEEASLTGLLARAGFTDVKVLPPEYAAHYYYARSYEIRSRRDPSAPVPNEAAVSAQARAADRAALAEPSLAESLTVVAFRPRASCDLMESDRNSL